MTRAYKFLRKIHFLKQGSLENGISFYYYKDLYLTCFLTHFPDEVHSHFSQKNTSITVEVATSTEMLAEDVKPSSLLVKWEDPNSTSVLESEEKLSIIKCELEERKASLTVDTEKYEGSIVKYESLRDKLSYLRAFVMDFECPNQTLASSLFGVVEEAEKMIFSSMGSLDKIKYCEEAVQVMDDMLTFKAKKGEMTSSFLQVK